MYNRAPLLPPALLLREQLAALTLELQRTPTLTHLKRLSQLNLLQHNLLTSKLKLNLQNLVMFHLGHPLILNLTRTPQRKSKLKKMEKT